jgi:hypothetical protein
LIGGSQGIEEEDDTDSEEEEEEKERWEMVGRASGSPKRLVKIL